MKKLILILFLAGCALFVYWGWTERMGKNAKKEASRVKGLAGEIVESGRDVGQKTGKMFDSIRLGQ